MKRSIRGSHSENRIRDGSGILFDVDVLKKTEGALQTREHEIHGIIETIPSMLWSTSPTGEVTHISQRVLGYPAFLSRIFFIWVGRELFIQMILRKPRRHFPRRSRLESRTVQHTVYDVEMGNIAGITQAENPYVIMAGLFSGTGFRLTSMSENEQRTIFAKCGSSLPKLRESRPWQSCHPRSLTN